MITRVHEQPLPVTAPMPFGPPNIGMYIQQHRGYEWPPVQLSMARPEVVPTGFLREGSDCSGGKPLVVAVQSGDVRRNRVGSSAG